jgi:integrase
LEQRKSQLSSKPNRGARNLGSKRICDLGKRIEEITHDTSKPYFRNALKKHAEFFPENANTICDYISTEITEINIKSSTKETKIKVLLWFSNFHRGKLFDLMTKQDILEYLNSLRKPTFEDQSQRWIGSYNCRQMILLKFFRWLHNQNESDPVKRITPACMVGVRRLNKKEKTPYKHSDIWNMKEHWIFLKYCPDKRDRCYHALAEDMSARPHEILNLKIKDIKFSIAENGIQYAEVHIRDGKTGPRTVPLIDSIPYLKEWIIAHPTATNPESWLFLSQCKNTLGRKLTYAGLVHRYSYYYKTKYFPNLLRENTVPPPDKDLIRSLLDKPFNLYILRHSAISEKSKYLSDSALKDHAGWNMSSKMPQIYVHLRGDSTKILLEHKGLVREEDKHISKLSKSKQCPNCSESNKIDARFCNKCMMILNYDGYTDIVKEKQVRTDSIASISDLVMTLASKVENLEKSVGLKTSLL